MSKPTPGQLSFDQRELVPLSLDEQSIVITALVCLAAQLEEAGIGRATAMTPEAVAAIANRMAEAMR